MTISEVSKEYKISADTLRYYEKAGLLPRISRKANGVRDYKPEDCQMIEFIKWMRSAGMPVDSLVKYFELMKQGDKTNHIRRQMLAEQRQVLLNKRQDIEETLKRLEYKIAFYDDKLSKRDGEAQENHQGTKREDRASR